ncbi:hypothetical protein [Solidesulfovibrio sp.]|uniref:hypothetical protein n=1 Tax=Solidesulfovibrio sp. TaxID=2910990 RepID=UPI002B1ED64C|nr:hypothetical protein [Solidesulfovibrio sp.]MEA5087565.1 hypothetical protein [Solidesulfovibrio sp.]
MAENLVSTGCNDDNTYPQTLMGVIETALAPMVAFKEILLDAGDDNGPVKLTDVGVAMEALTTFARHSLYEADATIRRDVGRIDLSLAKYGHPSEEVGTVLAATVQGSRIVPEVQKVAHHG